MTDTPGNKPDQPGPPDNPGPPDRAPGRTKWLDALTKTRGPLRPIEVYEKGNHTTVPGPERGTIGNSTAAELRELVRRGEAYAVYRDDQPADATRYGATTLGRKHAKD